MGGEKRRKREAEDASKYGEFICSYFNWISLDKQKEVAKELEEMTKDENKKGWHFQKT